MCGFDKVCRRKYVIGEPIRRAKVVVRGKKLKNGNNGGKDEVTGEMIKGGDERVLY